MTKTSDTYPFSASSCEGDDLLELRDGRRLEVELWTREEGLRPRMMKISSLGVECDRVVEPGQLSLEFRV